MSALGAPPRILVVEDDFLIALDLVDLVRGIGAVPIGPVGRVADALALLDAEGDRLAFAILDLDLRGLPTYPVADRLAVLGVRFTFLTGFSADAIADGYRHYPRLEKPVDAKILLAAMKQRD